MNVFGHHDVTDQGKFKALAEFCENLYKEISGMHRAQQRQALIATKSHEMEVVLAVDSL